MGKPASGTTKQLISDPIIELYKKDVDRTLIRHNLTLSVDQRFEQLMALQRFADELRRGGKEIRSRK